MLDLRTYLITVTILFILLFGCMQVVSTPELVDTWRIYSTRIDYTDGGYGAFGAISSSTTLNLNQFGIWEFGDSKGTWHAEEITDGDWEKWNTKSYGPTRKIVLDGWGGQTVDGPIEETEQGVDFFWLIYGVDKPTVSNPGIVQIKFGHKNLK
ncbi:hypothetical protein HY570_03110 [Candidatus Micrarchaeota archaeon]|nr:hypothetical protein [Candidatus Micrarchaeota archaeon]